MREVETAVATATQRAERADQAEDGFRAAFVAQRDAVASSGPPAPQGESLIEDWRALATWATDRSDELVDERASLAIIGKELAATKAELIDNITNAAAAVGLAAEPDRMTAAVAAASATAEADVERLTEQLAHKIELSDTVGELSEEQAVHEALGRKHLSANGFERWLLAEALDDMVERATVTLLTLSNGRYSLEAIDGSFSVRDHGNADERRDIRTLSGGEVFLASLALALALAESIADLAPVDSPRLESIFLDEGFGTLDLETLDVLASAIEELSASGRLVAVVTHVRDLAERMPTRFEVTKGSATSTIERVDG